MFNIDRTGGWGVQNLFTLTDPKHAHYNFFHKKKQKNLQIFCIYSIGFHLVVLSYRFSLNIRVCYYYWRKLWYKIGLCLIDEWVQSLSINEQKAGNSFTFSFGSKSENLKEIFMTWIRIKKQMEPDV